MIYLFCGDDNSAKTLACETFVTRLSEDLNLETLHFYRDNLDLNQIESFCSGPSLFSKKHALIFKDVLELKIEEEINGFFLNNIGKMAESENTFVFSEGKLDKKTIDIFKKSRAEINSFELPKGKKEKFNTFTMADALASRNKLNLWMLFRKALKKGVSLDEITGILFWKIKTMILNGEFSKFSETELKKLSSKVSKILPESRNKSEDSEVSFEKFLLEIF